MKEIQDKWLHFVLKHYQDGKLDTRKAIKKFKRNNGFERKHYTVWYTAGIAASILLCVVLELTFNKSNHNLTAQDTIKTFILPDGTSVTLSPHSSLSYDPEDCRTVEMTGKAFFKVKHDKAHPFNVTGSKARVTVLGTQFQITESESGSNVYVVCGKVKFSLKGKDNGIILTKGMKANLNNDAEIPQVVNAGSINQTAWATHRFIFDKTPLKVVLEELSSYHHITLSCSAATDKTLSGNFQAGDIDEIIDIINNVLNVKIQKP